MLKAFDGQYQPPSRKYFSGTAIPSLYSSVKQKMQEEVLWYADYFSGTVDLWSSVGLKPYNSYTIHYIEAEWKLQSKCIPTHFLPEDHTSDILADSLTTTLDTWMLKAENQICLTTDNGINIIKAAMIFSGADFPVLDTIYIYQLPSHLITTQDVPGPLDLVAN